MISFCAHFLFLAAFSLPAWGATWRVDSDEVQSSTQSEAEAVFSSLRPEEELGRAVWLQAAGHLALEASRPHEGRKYFLAVEDLCWSWQSRNFSQFKGFELARANGVCALVSAELAIHPFPVFSYFRLRRIASYTQAFLLNELPEVEKLHITARLRSALPPLDGLNFRSSLLSFRVMERLSPETKGTHYWLALTFRRQGQAELSLNSLHRAVEEADPRAVLVKPGVDRRWGSDLSYGFTLFPFVSPAKLQGLGVRYWDDRLDDGPFSLLASAEGSLRGNLSGALRLGYQWDTWSLFSEFEGGRIPRDFFGLGMQGSAPVLGFSTTLFQGGIGFSRSVGLQSLYSFGSVFQAMDAAPVPGAIFSSYGGAFVSFEWDARDRATLTRNGLRLGVKVKGLGSSLGAAVIVEPVFSAHRTFGLRHTFSLYASARATGGNLPVNALCDLYAMDMPLARQFRFQDSQGIMAVLSYRWLVAQWVHLSAFGVAGSVADRWEALFRSAAPGVGLGIDLQFERLPRFSPRWEFGNFAGEWIFQSAGRVAF
jgi:hypothetical protein